MTTFRQKIRENIENVTLQAALDGNAQHRVQGRINAFKSIPDWRERRQRAHAIRAEVIENLDSYLDLFVNKVTNNGFIVHHAKDAAEANQIALEIIKNIPGGNKGRGGQAKS